MGNDEKMKHSGNRVCGQFISMLMLCRLVHTSGLNCLDHSTTAVCWCTSGVDVVHVAAMLFHRYHVNHDKVIMTMTITMTDTMPMTMSPTSMSLSSSSGGSSSSSGSGSGSITNEKKED